MKTPPVPLMNTKSLMYNETMYVSAKRSELTLYYIEYTLRPCTLVSYNFLNSLLTQKVYYTSQPSHTSWEMVQW